VGVRTAQTSVAASADLRSPRLVLVGEPDQLGGEGAHQSLAFGERLVELAEEDCRVARDDDRTPAGLDDDDLPPWGVAWRRDEAQPRQQLKLAVDGHVLHAGRLDPRRVDQSACCCAVQVATATSASSRSRHSRTRPRLTVGTMPASSSTRTCLRTAVSDSVVGAARSPADVGPRASRSTMARRVGSPSAVN
jgi:hypothetical protein